MTADGSPAVTVGMAILNDARTLERAIASVLAQDFQRWRLIISDDGSTDGSDRIAESAAARDDRITLIRQSTRQGPMIFKAPLDLAGTPFFVWLSAGDRWHPQFLALTVQALSAAAPAVSALPQAAWIGPPERPIPNLGFLKGSASGRVRRYLASPDDTRIFGLMRTELLQRAFPQEPFHGFELYLMARLLAKGAQLYVPQTLLFRDAATASDRARRHAAGTGVPRKLPAWPLSRHLIRDRALPLGALPALVRLNLAARADPNFFRPLPDADTASAMARPAPDTPPKVAPTAPQSRHAGTEPLITAILPFRNAASTLAAVLKHLHALDCRIIAIDHGSTDGSRAIAEAAGVDQLVHDPWTGFQDLTRQLRMRQHLIASASTPWVIHAHADAFLDPPEGLPLAEVLARATAAGFLAFPCDEHLFLPLYEDEEHSPDSFQTTMTHAVRPQRRDPPQRLMRREADLALWLATGGQTVTHDPKRIAQPRLTLRRYPGLSLDDLRGRYLSRVFAPQDRDRLRRWDKGPEAFDIVEPGPIAPGLVCTGLPFLCPRVPEPPRPPPPLADLYLLADAALASDPQSLGQAFPGLRLVPISVADLAAMRRTVPVLNLLSHPAGLHGRGIQRSQERARAEDWTRRIAIARQWALDRNAPYAEIRVEDLDNHAEWRNRLLHLWQPPVLRGALGFIGPDAAPVRRDVWSNPVRSVTAPLAADLGYF